MSPQKHERPAELTTAPQCIGLSLEAAEKIDPEQLVFHPNGTTPVLVSTEALHWYNDRVIQNIAKPGAAYLFTHQSADSDAARVIKDIAEKGDLILINTDGSGADLSQQLIGELQSELALEIETIESVVQNQYVGFVEIDGCNGYNYAPTPVQVYLDSPDLLPDATKTEYAALLGSIEGEQLERIWEIYRSRFNEVAEISITEAAFDEISFKDIMQDPAVVKAVYFQNGKIVNLMMFMTDLSHASWLNESHFANTYPDAYDTKNIMLFLGVVSDPDASGSLHSLAPMRLLLEVAQKRHSNCVITFECNEVSSDYLPKIVKFGINHSGIAKVDGLDEPVATSSFISIRKNPNAC